MQVDVIILFESISPSLSIYKLETILVIQEKIQLLNISF